MPTALVVNVAVSSHLNLFHQQPLILVHQLVLVKETDELSLPWLQNDLTCELIHSKSLDNVKYVNLQVKLLLGILMYPILAFRFDSATEAASRAKLSQKPTPTVLV